MPVGRGAYAADPRGVGKGETGRAFFGDQAKRRLQPPLSDCRGGTALAAALVLSPAHVKGFYMSRVKRSLILGCHSAFIKINGVRVII